MAYGSIIDAMSGVASANGTVGGGPTDFPMSLPDPCAGIHTAIATVAALYRARRQEPAQRVECAMLEVERGGVPVARAVSSRHRTRGTRGRQPRRGASPHDVFPCRGVYEWVAIAVRDDSSSPRSPGSWPIRRSRPPALRHAHRPPRARGRPRIDRLAVDRGSGRVRRRRTSARRRRARPGRRPHQRRVRFTHVDGARVLPAVAPRRSRRAPTGRRRLASLTLADARHHRPRRCSEPTPVACSPPWPASTSRRSTRSRRPACCTDAGIVRGK